VPLRLGDRNETVRQWRGIMHARFGGDTGLYARLHGPLPTDTDEFGPRARAWQEEYERRTQQHVDGEVSDNDLRALGLTPPPVIEPDVVAFSVNGAGSQWNFGYPIDMVHRAVPDYTRDIFDQPIGYDTRPVPMDRGVKTGEAEIVNQLARPRGARGRNCTELFWTGASFSMGALAFRRVVDRVLWGDLGQYKHTFLGDVALGNPRRQRDHTFPGCPPEWSTGEGIATPTDHDLPVECWDLAADKDMPNAGGDDLYTKMADDENERTTKNMRAVWDIVNKGNPLSLGAAVLLLLATPSFSGGYAAAVAAFKALDFFVVKQTSPHMRYHLVQPVPGDPRDSFELGRLHLSHLIARRQPIFPRP
jgi:hypothetical protein